MTVRTILADRVSLSEFSNNWTIFVLISGTSFGLGPLIGGYLTKVSWRWCFGINLPIAAVSIVLVALLLRKELVGPQPLPELGDDTQSRRERLLIRISTIDFTGQLLFLWGLGLLLLAFTWAGSTYSWSSPAVLAPMVIGAVATAAWVLFERSMAPGKAMSRVFSKQRPMMPWEILSQRDNCLIFLINFTAGMAMFAAMYFMDLYFTQVEGKSNSDAGIGLLYYMPGLLGKHLFHQLVFPCPYHNLTTMVSWRFHGTLCHWTLASSDVAITLLWGLHHGCRHYRNGLRCPRPKHCAYLRHAGTYRPRHFAAPEPCIAALSRLLSQANVANHLPYSLCSSLWRSSRLDYYDHGVQ
jgi:MFS family permease